MVCVEMCRTTFLLVAEPVLLSSFSSGLFAVSRKKKTALIVSFYFYLSENSKKSSPFSLSQPVGFKTRSKMFWAVLRDIFWSCFTALMLEAGGDSAPSGIQRDLGTISPWKNPLCSIRGCCRVLLELLKRQKNQEQGEGEARLGHGKWEWSQACKIIIKIYQARD